MLLWVILLELQSPVEFPKRPVGNYVARWNVGGLALLGQFIYYQAELVELIDRVCTAVLVQFMYLNTWCPLKAVSARKIIVVTRP